MKKTLNVSPKVTIKNRYNRTPDVGQTFTKKSMTLPGQDVTPSELIRLYARGAIPPGQVYSDLPLSSFDRMDTLDKMDYLRDLAERNSSVRAEIQYQLQRLHKVHLQEKRKKEEDDFRDKVIKEMKEKKE